MASESKSSSAPRARGPQRRSPARRIAIAIGAFLAAWLVATAIVRATYADRIMPGTSVGGVDLGGASTGEARARLSSVFGPGRRVTARIGERRFAIDPEQVGYDFDAEATVRRARDVGRDGAVGGLGSTLVARLSRHDLEPVVRVDGALLAARIAEIAGEVDRPLSPGALVADTGEPGGIGVQAPRRGLTVRREPAARAVAAALRDRRAAAIALPVEVQPSVDPARVRAVARRARAYAAAPLALRTASGTRTIGTRRTARLLALERTKGLDVRLGVDPEALRALVDELAADLDRAARDARIAAPRRPPVVVREQGELTWRPRKVKVTVRAARAGRTLKREEAGAAIAAAVRAGRHEVRLPFARAAPRVATAAARKVDALLGTFTTPYACCQPRVKNIGLMAEEVDGFVVLPGERFSLNGATGERTEAEGYVPAPFIADGKIEDSVGGGVSQFSTTLYNAAYFAGVQIETHRPHSFYIDRYPAGREATLNYPDIDMAWTNDTSAPVVIRTATDATSVTASIYGADHGRRVRASNGDRVKLDDGDFSITVTRVLRYRDGKVDREPFTTRYDRPPPPE